MVDIYNTLVNYAVTMKQKDLAKKLNVSDAYLSMLINRQRVPNWNMAKRIAEITDTTPYLWLEGSSDEIREALKSTTNRPGEAA